MLVTWVRSNEITVIGGQLETVSMRIGKWSAYEISFNTTVKWSVQCTVHMWILWKEYLWISTIVLWTYEMGQYHEMNSKENEYYTNWITPTKFHRNTTTRILWSSWQASLWTFIFCLSFNSKLHDTSFSNLMLMLPKVHILYHGIIRFIVEHLSSTFENFFPF